MATKEKKPATQDYVALVVFGGDNERWLPGSKIALTDEQALIHLRLGNVAPLDETVTPVADVGPALIIHEAGGLTEEVDPDPKAKKEHKT